MSKTPTKRPRPLVEQMAVVYAAEIEHLTEVNVKLRAELAAAEEQLKRHILVTPLPVDEQVAKLRAALITVKEEAEYNHEVGQVIDAALDA